MAKIAFLFLLFVALSCNTTPVNFSVNTPYAWLKLEDSANGSKEIKLYPNVDGEYQGFVPQIKVNRITASNAEDYRDVLLQETSKNTTEYSLLQKGTKSVNGHDFYFADYIARFSPAEVGIHKIAYFTAQKGYVFQVNYVAAPKDSSTFKPYLDSVVSSFKVDSKTQ